jgi:Holliday junction resolvasome RuvABC ATP-dependent DNA helicase subunit
MPTNDSFGIQSERKINQSKIRSIFTPHTPVNSIDLFLGRTEEVKAIVAQINTPGQHSLLFGDRGVGKSSLANIATAFIFNSKRVKGALYRRRCDSSSTFESILEGPLSDVGFDIKISRVVESHQEGGNASIGLPGIGGGIKSDRTTSQETQGMQGKVSPSQACEILKSHQALLVVDELDAIRNPEEKWRLSEFIKQLSDENAQFKVLGVGIAKTATDLTAGHPSVGRCLKETKLSRMHEKELRQIIIRGAEKLKIKFEQSVIDAIVKLSDGYPHFTHLLALTSGEQAITHDRKLINEDDLKNALASAAKNAEGTLKTMYENATVSQSTDMYKQIVCAAATIKEHEFGADELRQAIFRHTGANITQGTLNNYLKRLVSDDSDTIFKRRTKGVYAFNDPRMSSFVRIANNLL